MHQQHFGYFSFDPHEEEQAVFVEQKLKGLNVDKIISFPVDDASKSKKILSRLASGDKITIYSLGDIGTIASFKSFYDKALRKDISVEILDGITTKEAIKAAIAQEKGLRKRAKSRYADNSFRWGSPPFGYKNHEGKLAPSDKKVKVGNEEITEFEQARRCLDVYLIEKNLRKTVKRCKDSLNKNWSTSGLNTWLSNPAIAGHTINKNVEWYNTHISLVSPEEFEEIKRAAEEGKKRWGQHTKRVLRSYPLKGQLRCGFCGFSMFRYKAYGADRLRCRRRDEAAFLCENKEGIFLKDVCDKVASVIIGKASEIQKKMVEERIEKPENLMILESQIAILKNARDISKDSNEEMMSTVLIEECLSRLEHQEKEETKKFLFEYEASQTTLDLIASKAIASPAYWASISDETKTQIFKELVETVSINKGEVFDIKFRF